MIFRQWQQVLDGTKTQTRRLVKDGDRLRSIGNWDHGKLLKPDYYVDDENGRNRWCTYRTYAVQPGRGKKAVGRIRITEIRRERVRDISREDIEAEGTPCNPMNQLSWRNDYYQRLRDFAQLWDSIHKKPGTRWEDDPEVWVLSFEVVQQT